MLEFLSKCQVESRSRPQQILSHGWWRSDSMACSGELGLGRLTVRDTGTVAVSVD
jgi:hypothetical protein